MLSPASLRVCCLAAMAPALTKADRQADCLPGVLSESFCVSKTPDRFNSEENVNGISLKCAYSSEYAQKQRKPFMQRACWRTQKSGNRFVNRNRSVGFVSTKSLPCSGKIRTLRDAKLKSWQNTNSTTAYAGKIKLKYTMSKHISNHKNMGLAKANTSLGLQSYKKANQFSKENQNSGPNMMEDSLSFSDSTDSTVQVRPLISDITVIATDSDVSPMDKNVCEVIPNENASETVLDTPKEQSVSETVNSQPVLESAGADLVEAMDTSNVSVTLTDLSCPTTANVEPAKDIETDSVTDVVSVSPGQSQIPFTVTLQTSNDSNLSTVNNSNMDESSMSENAILSSPPVSPSATCAANKFVVDNKKLENLFSRSFSSKSLLPSWNCSRLLLNASKLYSHEEQLKCPVLTDFRFGLNYNTYVRKEKKVCCLPSKQELGSVQSMLADKSESVRTILTKSTHLLRKQMCVYIKKQISSLVEHYQRKFQISCQRLAKQNVKSEKDLVDLKAELLQSEDVKSMSTAALVNLVRKLESSGTQPEVSPKMSGTTPLPNEALASADYEEIKHTSEMMLNSLKTLVRMSDPYNTDTSDEECLSDETEDEEEEIEDSTYVKSALYKYMTERAALASSSTWLLARNHELEYRIKEYDERWSELIKAEGKVCLLEPNTVADLALCTESENALQKSAKHPATKSFMPLNGYINPSDTLHIAKTTADESILQELESSIGTEFDKDAEESCCRTKPLDIKSFRKRKLAFIPGLHVTNPKFTRLSSVNCECNSQSDLSPCILCTGQYSSVQSVDPHSMALRDRIAILDPYFHPALSTNKDIPLCLQLENYFKIEAVKRRIAHPVTHDINHVSEDQPLPRPKFSELRSQSKLSIYARSLSAKYRNKHNRNSGHYRRHKLVFGKWRRLHNRNALRARTHFRRRYSVASSDSSPDSPVHSPSPVFEDGLEKKQREGNQFDIDNVIIPCNSRSGRLVEIQYKEIMIPNWRSVENEIMLLDGEEPEEPENISDAYLIKRHEMLEVEEKEKVKRTALGLSRRRRIRCDSRADSSGANTPDPTTLYNNQENVFRVPNFTGTENPVSPASPATPNSAVASDDSEPAFGHGSTRLDSKVNLNKKLTDESTSSTHGTVECEVFPFEPLQFPLTDELYDNLVTESEHDKQVFEFSSFTPNYPPSPVSATSSTSTVEEEEEDFSDPEWTVVKPIRNGPDQTLVLKFAKR